jgi:hypothetical protein
MAGLSDIIDFIRSKFSPRETETEVVQERDYTPEIASATEMGPIPEEEYIPSLPIDKPVQEKEDIPPEFERTMLIEDHPTDYIEGAQDRVHEKIKRYNANPNAVIGIMANMLGENRDFDYKKKEVGGTKRGRGLFQFDSMRKNYGIYLDEAGIPDSENAQIHWAMDQIYGDPVKSELGYTRAKKLRDILENPKTTSEEATTAFFEIFENPSAPNPDDTAQEAKDRAVRRQKKLDKRLEYIKEFETKATGGMVMRDPYSNYNKQRAI